MSHSLESALKRLKGMYLVVVCHHLDNETNMYMHMFLSLNFCQLKCVYLCVFVTVCVYMHMCTSTAFTFRASIILQHLNMLKCMADEFET